MSDAVAWARLFATARPAVRPMPRAGAWYPVVQQLEGRVVLEVGDKRVAVPTNLLEIREQRPKLFTVVRKTESQANPADGTPEDPGRVYVVCPECHLRTHVSGEPVAVKCDQCGHFGEVAWWD